MMEDLDAISAIDSLQSFHLEVSKLLESCRIQCLLCIEVYGSSLGPAKMLIKLISLKMSLLKVCNGTLAHTEERSALPGFYVNFSEKEKRLS